ncbi:diacylglycerol kinase family protein [Raoultibacter phocaeensis]|uniref:diacylglycerol kinase family protein n=1 Tax=Raoultibacter phocaeensis TaxID=2479841 RepID=UPI001117C34D|nr:diacylglycerol kinase family protein [Raoultibacter phocaeensis]
MGDVRKAFVRNAKDKSQGTRFPLGSAFTCATCGFAHAFKTQRNMKIHLAVAIVAVILGAVLGIDALGWAAIAICIALVFAAECMNTALEAIVDLASPEYSELAKHAKDCAAGAVLVSAVGSVVVALFVYIPPLAAWAGL